MSARTDNVEKRFCQIGDSLLFSKAYMNLTAGAMHLYICMAMESRGKRQFELPASKAVKYGFAKRTFWNYVSELETAGFIKRQSGRFTRENNLYEFCSDWKNTSVSVGR